MAEDLSRFCCFNPDCPEHGKRNHGTIAIRARYGPRKTLLLYGKICKRRFSERKGTPLFDSHLPPELAHAVLAHRHEGRGIRQTERLVGVHRRAP